MRARRDAALRDHTGARQLETRRMSAPLHVSSAVYEHKRRMSGVVELALAGVV